MGHRTQVTTARAGSLRSLGLPVPTRILEVSEEARTTCLSSLHASRTPCVSY
jgi:hypothetical protein